MCYLCDERERANTMVPTTVEAPKEEVKEVPTSRTLTREMFLKGEPCWHYRNQFDTLFPESVEVTVELAVSQANDWDWFWAAENLLSQEGYEKFKTACRAVDKVRTDTLAPYTAVRNAARRAAEEEQDKKYQALLASGVRRWDAEDQAYEFQQNLLNVLGYNSDFYNSDVVKAAEKAYIEAQAQAWAELFLTDKDAYEEQHKNDEPFVEYIDEDDDY